MNMALIEQIMRYASFVISLIVFLITATTFIVNRFKIKRKKLNAEEENEQLQEQIEDKDACYKLVNEIIPLAIKKAEDTPFVDGKTKKLLALSEILLNCNSQCIDFEAYKDFISEQIENLIEFSKTINKRKED